MILGKECLSLIQISMNVVGPRPPAQTVVVRTHRAATGARVEQDTSTRPTPVWVRKYELYSFYFYSMCV